MLRQFLIAVGIGVVTGSLTAGQAPAGGGQRAGGPPPPMKNLQVLPRVMMQMTNDINTKLAASIKKPAAELTRVACATCHRGAAIPVVPPPPAATPAPPTVAPVR